jgi:hypothetical protein
MEHGGGPQAAADGQVLVLGGFEQEEQFQLFEFLRIRAARSFAWLQSSSRL